MKRNCCVTHKSFFNLFCVVNEVVHIRMENAFMCGCVKMLMRNAIKKFNRIGRSKASELFNKLRARNEWDSMGKIASPTPNGSFQGDKSIAKHNIYSYSCSRAHPLDYTLVLGFNQKKCPQFTNNPRNIVPTQAFRHLGLFVMYLPTKPHFQAQRKTDWG